MTDPRRKNIAILSFALVVVMLGFGMVIPVYPFFIQKLGASGSALGLLVAIAALTEFVFGPIWGSLSDQTGRKPILIIGMLGYALSMALFGLSTELWMLFASRALSGVLSAAALSTSMAYIGDSLPGRQRGGGMGLLGAAAGVGTILGPGLGGLLAGGSLATPFFFAAGLSLLALVLIAVLLPESLTPEARAAAKNEGHGPQLNALRAAVAPGSPIRGLLLLAFIATVGTSNFEAVFSLYMLQSLSYGPEQVGVVLMVVGVIALVGRGLLTGPVTRHWGEPAVIQAALITGGAGFIALLLARGDGQVLLATGLFVFATTFLRPSIHALTSQRAATGQGSAMGMSNAFVSLGRMVGPLYAGFVFDLNPLYPFASGAVVLLAVFAFSRGWLGRAGEAVTAQS
jgi:DHA1 family multidrug resistance protein-like MFS transporter